jgi:hypothetical protein
MSNSVIMSIFVNVNFHSLNDIKVVHFSTKYIGDLFGDPLQSHRRNLLINRGLILKKNNPSGITKTAQQVAGFEERAS